MSIYAEAREWDKQALSFWRMAGAETDPTKKAELEKRAEYWDTAAEEAWRDAKSEADVGAADDHAYDRDGADGDIGDNDRDDMGNWGDW